MQCVRLAVMCSSVLDLVSVCTQLFIFAFVLCGGDHFKSMLTDLDFMIGAAGYDAFNDEV